MNSRITQTIEGGSVATFVVVGVVLAALVIGGVFIVQKSGHEQPITSPGKSTQPSPSNSPSKAPATSAAPKPTKTPASPSPTIRPPVTGTAPAQPLPKTGPSDDWMSILMFAGLVGMIAAYVQSHRYKSDQLGRQQVD